MQVVKLTIEGMVGGKVEVIVVVQEWKEELNVIYVREPHALPHPRHSPRRGHRLGHKLHKRYENEIYSTYKH